MPSATAMLPGCRILAVGVASVLALATWPVRAAPADPPEEGKPAEPEPSTSESGSDAPAAAPESATTEPKEIAEAEGDPEPPADTVEDPETAEGPQVTAIERPDAPKGGGVAGSVISADDPDAGRATSDLEGESLAGKDQSDVPERMEPLQAAAWWTMFGTVALATAGGVFSGVAEKREDDAERIAFSYDTDTGARVHYDEVRDEYERLLDEGNTYQWVARGFLIGSGVALITSIALFAAHGKRKRSQRNKVAIEPIGGGMAVSF